MPSAIAGFEIVSAIVPDGMTATVQNGAVVVSGYVSDPNAYTIEVVVKGNGGFGYIEREVELEMVARLAGETGSSVSFFGGSVRPEVIDPNVEPSADTVGVFKSVNYEIVGDAHGFTIAADGTVTGTLAAGETTITVKQTGEQVVGSGGWRPSYSLQPVEYTRTITLFGDEGSTGGLSISASRSTRTATCSSPIPTAPSRTSAMWSALTAKTVRPVHPANPVRPVHPARPGCTW